MLHADLQDAVARLGYKPGWTFRLHGGPTMAAGSCARPAAWPPASGTVQAVTVLVAPLFLIVCARVADSRGGGEITVEHTFAVPPEEYPVPAHRWLLDRVLDVERHEACEFFALGDERPFYPEHGNPAVLYQILERAA